MKRYRLTESDLHNMIRNIVKRVLKEDTSEDGIPRFTGTEGNKEDEVSYAKSIIEIYKKELIRKTEGELEDYDFSDFNFEYDDRKPNWGTNNGYAHDNDLDFEYEFKVGDIELSFNVGVNVDVTEYPGRSGTYFDPPEYDEYDYVVQDMYVCGFYYYDGENEICLNEEDINVDIKN